MKSQEGLVWEERDQLLDKPHECSKDERKMGRKWEVEGLDPEVLRGIWGRGPAVCIAHKHPRWCGHTARLEIC